MKNNVSLSIIRMVFVLVITGMSLMSCQKAKNWPQWRGADRDGFLKDISGLNLDWSVKKPQLLWTFRQAGLGYSSPVVVGTTLYCQGAMNESGFAFALDTKTGDLKWKQELGKEYVENREHAPRGTITVDGDLLYLIRGNGQMHCLSATDGKVVWQKDLIQDFNGKIMSSWGFGESPLIDGNLVICSPGGSDGTVMALDKKTGALVWRTKEWTDASGHSSPIIATIGGIRQYIQQAKTGVAGISAKDGKVLWKTEIPNYLLENNRTVIPTPIYWDNMVYVSNGYGCGCACVQITKTGDSFKANTIYTNKNMVNHHGGVVLKNGNIYGYSDAGWVCQDMKTGEAVWSKRAQEAGVGKGAVLGVGERLLLLEERNGTVTVIAASPDGWKEFGKLEIPERTELPSIDKCVWAHLVVADDKLFVRDHDLLFCFDMKQ